MQHKIYVGRRKYYTICESIESNRIESNQADRINSHQIEPARITVNQIELGQHTQIESIRIKSNQIESIEANRIKSNQIEPNQIEGTRQKTKDAQLPFFRHAYPTLCE